MGKTIVAIVSSLLLLSCSDDKTTEVNKGMIQTTQKSTRVVDDAQIKRGRQLYLKSCTVCHGINGEGSPDWRKRDADGMYPPPPVNGTGHAWHHSKKVLVDTIKNGTAKLGGKMPGWKDKLSDQEIDDIIAWFQSLWPDQLYEVWQLRDQEARNKK